MGGSCRTMAACVWMEGSICQGVHTVLPAVLRLLLGNKAAGHCKPAAPGARTGGKADTSSALKFPPGHSI